MSKKNNQLNAKGKRHELWELYYSNGINNKRHGYFEFYYSNGNMAFKGSYNHGKEIGYWEVYNENGDINCISFCL